MVWNGVSLDLSCLACSGRHERSDLWFIIFWDMGRDTFHGTDGFGRWSSCGLCGGDSKSTSLDNSKASKKRLKGAVVFLGFGVDEGKVVRWSYPPIVSLLSESRSVLI